MFCPECKAELPDDAKYCIRCGYDFTRIKTPPPGQPSDLLGRLRTSPRSDQPEAPSDFGEILKKGEVFAHRYRILSEGKRGGMGVVYKCEDQKLNRMVALKIIHPGLISSEQAVKRFRQEVSISLELLHKNIVRVHNLDEYEGIEFFTMEWVEGKSLREILNGRVKEKKPFTLEEAYVIISQLCYALQYAHKSTVHRDIKPENILTYQDEEGLRIKVTDFGIAKMLTPAQFTTTSLQIGTPYYMAPEQKVDAAHVDKRADVYAVGVVLFELLTLENTIGLEMPSEINQDLPKEIDQIIKKAIATKPENRYGDIKELSDGLGNVVKIWKQRIEEERKKEERLLREAEEAERRRREEERKKKEEEKRRIEELRKKEEEEKRKEEKRKRDEEERIRHQTEEKKRAEEAKERALWLIERGKESESAGKYQEALNYYREADEKSIDVSVKELIAEVERKIKEEEEREKKKQEEERRLVEVQKWVEEAEKRRNTAFWSGLAIVAVILLIVYFSYRESITRQAPPPAPKEKPTQVIPPAPTLTPPKPILPPAPKEEKSAEAPAPMQKETKPSLISYDDEIGVIKIRSGEPIHIACWMVVAGPDASLGVDTKRGVEIAIDDKGGRILGFPIKLSVQDTGCNAEGGQAAATKLAADPTIVAAVGPNCSSEARIGAPILWKAGIATVSPSNTAPFLTDPRRGKDYEGYLRTSHNDKEQGAVAAEFAIEYLRVKEAATIHDGSPYAEQLQAEFVKIFRRLGGVITAQEIVSPTGTNMRPVMTGIAAGRPELIYFPIFIGAGAHVARQARELSGMEKTYLMGADSTFSPDFYKAAGQAAVGMFHTSPDFSSFTYEYKDVLVKYRRKYGENPIAPFHAHAYDAAMMVFSAIEKVAKTAPDGTLHIGRQKLRNALYATQKFNALTGTLNCNQYGDCGDTKIAVYKTTEENVRKVMMPSKPFWKLH